ncbi:MAG: ribonuclease HII [Nitrospinota bacterium]|nr:ribonuclease HII [Nitrospinota bacterium]
MRIAGVDEAGRGPLAGPVVASAVILNGGKPPHPLVDSKSIGEERRERIFDWLFECGAEIGIGIVEHDEIDRINILQASLLAMKKAVEMISPMPEMLQIDGQFTISGFSGDIRQEAVIKGDTKIEAISAASIVAKVTRDRIMKKYHEEYPQYGFAKHKGYPTASHKKAIAEHGPSPIHRLSFRGVKGI